VGCEAKTAPVPVANAPPIGVFLAYAEQPGSSVDDTITAPDYPAEGDF
jgi:hypothetical protein